MVDARFRWVFPVPVVLDPSYRAAAERLGLSVRVAELLAARGLTDPLELARTFAPAEDGLHDPRLLPDADRFAARIEQARTANERVLVFGDFDADGLTGLAIMTLCLRRLGITVEPYVPSRLDEGHGLSMAAVETAVRLAASVIVTVDCGTTSVLEIGAAVAAGIDVLVTDHHRVPPALPPATAIVNAYRPDATYPDRRLAGSGVAFKLAELLLGRAAARDLADLATIGTVADVAPVIGENRSIARLGLEQLRGTPRPGIAALLRRSGVQPADVDLETVSFVIAPRLNAAGRVGEALQAANLLLADDPIVAGALADQLESANQERRDLTRTVIGEARSAVEGAEAATSPSATLVRGDWPVGIIGLVASRLAEDLGRPAVVGANLGPLVRASCRSDGHLDLGATLEACRDLFLRYGGHAGAAGFELPLDNWAPFCERFLILSDAAATGDRRTALQLDLALPAASVDYGLHRELARLAPFGPGNPDPLVAILGMTVTRVRAATGGHTQLTLRRVRDVVDGIAFNWPELAEAVQEGDRLDVVGKLTSRAFGGLESLQIEIRDVARSGSLPEAAAILEAVLPTQPAAAVAGSTA